MLNLKTIALGIVIALGAGAASAATINVYNDDDLNTSYSDVLRGTVTCDTCSVLNYDGTSYSFETSMGELFDGASAPPEGNPPSQEADWLNAVLTAMGLPAGYTATDDDKTEDADDNFSYMSSALYVILKLGDLPNYTILRNDGFGEFSFSWSPAPRTGAGLSHFTEIGVAPIPLPAAGFLMLGALGALGVAARRRKA